MSQYFVLKVSEMKTTAPKGDSVETNSSSDSRESEVKQEPASSSSSSVSEELQGFTLASDIYSVMATSTCVF